MKVVVAGGSGSLGRLISADLARAGHEVVVLTRRPRPGVPGRQVPWDGRTRGAWADELSGAALINLCGVLVDRPPTAANIALLTRSRVEPTLALAEAARLAGAPLAWIQMSTLAIYGDAGDQVLDETARPADGPPQMAGVARAWEEAAASATAGRVVVLRTGIVLDPAGPAMRRLCSLVRFGLGGRISSGRQWVSWLHAADFLAIMRAALTDRNLAGITHATSPNPVTNAELMAGLRHVLRRPPAPPTPAWLLQAGALLLRSDPALALTGRRCVPGRLLNSGFAFSHADIEPALADLLRRT
ncbi:MAG TPA: DUF1731 domain-containing protein [Streptosporangiaceae bacterium]